MTITLAKTPSSSSSIVTLSYNDLVSFNNKNGDDMSMTADHHNKRLMEQIACAYGSNGFGILAVRGVPGFAELRQRLLPLAARIPEMPPDDLAKCVVPEASYAVGWSHGKEELTPGVPDLSKGSYYANPLTNDLVQAMLARRQQRRDDDKSKDDYDDDNAYEQQLRQIAKENPGFFAPNVFPSSLPDLEAAICETGQCIAKVGCLVARVCQAYCETQGVTPVVDLEKILKESLNCKARLLHYFDVTTKESTSDKKLQQENGGEDQQLWWCGWHNDHGSLTGLVPAMYLKKSVAPNDEKQQQHLTGSPDPTAGLYIQSRTKELVKVNLPSDCLGFQIGETFQILSGGLLQATPHAVKQPSKSTFGGITRETFAVFLEPEFDFPMSIPAGQTVDDCAPENQANQALKLNSIQSRWKAGMTFGEFHNVTIQTFLTGGSTGEEEN